MMEEDFFFFFFLGGGTLVRRMGRKSKINKGLEEFCQQRGGEGEE